MCLHRGNLDLPAIFPIFGSLELEVLSVLSAFVILFTHTITAWCAKEQPQTALCVIFFESAWFRTDAGDLLERKWSALRRKVFEPSCEESGMMRSHYQKRSNLSYACFLTYNSFH